MRPKINIYAYNVSTKERILSIKVSLRKWRNKEKEEKSIALGIKNIIPKERHKNEIAMNVSENTGTRRY